MTTRTAWADLPDDVRERVAELLGGPVTRAVSQSNGFSPGSADRVSTAAGERAFVKTAHRTPHHPGTYDLHRRELGVMKVMPRGVRVPSLLGSFVSDDWVALILDDIDGRHPGDALDGADIIAVLDALATLPELRGAAAADLPRAADELAVDASRWATIQDEGAVGELPDWAIDNFDRLRRTAEQIADAAEGDHLQHLDCRADNVLIDRAGTAWIIDWPWAGVGACWLDGLCYLLDARLRGEDVDAEELLRTHPLFAGVPASHIDALLAALTGGFFAKARRPAVPSMPTLRDFQLREALAGMEWLRQRWG